MGENAKLAKAIQELEEIYLGVPDDSVNLSFKDLAGAQVSEDRKPIMEPIHENDPAVDPMNNNTSDGGLRKLPSLDFSRGLQASSMAVHQYDVVSDLKQPSPTTPLRVLPSVSPLSPIKSIPEVSTRSTPFRDGPNTVDDLSFMSGVSSMNGRTGRKRPGIPHSNICTICSVYIYIFRHRCLVCGRVYCRECVSMGMGEMTEGRKCMECLGKRFSQRYIKKAGEVGCYMGYPSRIKQQEMRWADMGPRSRANERRYGVSGHVSRSRSPVMPRTPPRVHITGSPTSFVISGTYSPTAHHIPF